MAEMGTCHAIIYAFKISLGEKKMLWGKSRNRKLDVDWAK